MAKGAKKIQAAQDVVTREYTIHLRKLLHGVGFKKRAPRAVKEVKAFAKKMMGTEVRDCAFRDRLSDLAPPSKEDGALKCGGEGGASPAPASPAPSGLLLAPPGVWSCAGLSTLRGGLGRSRASHLAPSGLKCVASSRPVPLHASSGRASTERERVCLCHRAHGLSTLSVSETSGGRSGVRDARPPPCALGPQPHMISDPCPVRSLVSLRRTFAWTPS
jgi:hypothetical protein